MSKIHEDCFAFAGNTYDCKVLKELQCRYGECPFYKTKEQFQDERARCAKRRPPYDSADDEFIRRGRKLQWEGISVRVKMLRGSQSLALHCKLCGIPASTWKSWEEGRTIPGLENIEKIADRFNVSTEWLMYGEENEE